MEIQVMRFIKQIAVSIVLTLAIFFGVVYTSCTKDACKGVTCLNNTTCSGGSCNCSAKPGLGGSNCEIIYRNLYAFPYSGLAKANGNLDSLHAVDSSLFKNTLVFNAGNDTSDYTTMNLDWNDSAGRSVLNMPIKIKNSSSTGSDFTVSGVVKDTFTYNGTGNVNTVSASLYLTRTHPHGSSAVVFSFNNFNR